MQIIHTTKFARQYKKLTPDVQEIAESKEAIFTLNPFDTRLKTHQLSGPLEGLYSFSVTQSIRIIFKKYEDCIIFLRIGTHNIYD